MSQQVENLLNLMGHSLGWVTFFILLFLGKKLPRKGDWLVGIYLFTILGFQIFSWREQLQIGWQPVYWLMNWVESATTQPPKALAFGPTIALIREPFQLSLVSLTTLTFMVLLMNQDLIHSGERQERSLSAMVLGFGGLLLMCQASNFWTLILGMGWTVLAGWIAFSSHWEIEREADLATRFVREKSIALGLITAGGLMVQGSGFQIQWVKAMVEWPAQQVPEILMKAGGSLMMLGALFIAGSFPWLGWNQMASRQTLLKRTLFGFGLPTFSAMILLVRLDPMIRGLGISNVFAWISLASGLLISVAAMAELKKESFFLQTAIASVGLGIAGGLFSSPWITAALLVGTFIVALAVSLTLSFSSIGTENQDGTRINGESISQPILFVSGLLFSGFFGFVSGPGILKSYLGLVSVDNYVGVTIFAITHLLVVISAFRFSFGTKVNPDSKLFYIKWLNALSPVYLLLMGSAWIWTGALAAEMVPGLMDQVMISLLDQLFDGKSIQASPRIGEAMAFHWSVFVVGIACSYWMTRGNPDRFEKWVQASPRFGGFLSEQYALDKFGKWAFRNFSTFSSLVEGLVDLGFWRKSLPLSGRWTRKALGIGFGQVDRSFRDGINQGAIRGVGAIGWITLQLQGGKLQTYWYVTLFSGIILIIYLLITRGLS